MNNNEDTTNQHLKWSSHYTVETAPEEYNSGDKVVLPASALEQLLSNAGSSGTLPSPLTFQLSHPHSGATLHCGVNEFSSSSNTTMLIPTWIMTALALQDGDYLLIKLDLLPKGTWAQLQPLSADYRDITDYRAALEAHLRGHYHTLTKGQTLSCHYGGKAYQFQVLQLKPQDAVSITDTDLEVEMEPIKTELKDGGFMTTTTTTAKSDVVQLNQQINADIQKDGYKYWKLILEKQEKHILLKLSVTSGNADIVISSTERMPTLDHHEWSDLSSYQEKSLSLVCDTTSHVYVGIHAFNENTTVSWEASKEETNMEIGSSEGQQQEEDRTGKVLCGNCHAWVLERTLPLHQGFCLRNNVICSWGCGKVFKKGSEELQQHWHCDQCEAFGDHGGKEKHMAYNHTPKTCVCSQFTADAYEALAEHKRSTCAEKMITCRYCHILTAQGVMSLDARDRLLDLHSHESYCGSRTITCQKCNKPIPIKDIQVHAKIHDVKRQQQTLPPPCSNRNCIRSRVKNRLSFCQYCFGPFWITDNDPKNAKLIQRVARKIHAQLTVGCGNAWCRNENCATFTKEFKDATTAASLLIPMIKPLSRELNLPNPNPELYLCVDESTTRKKFLAELLSSESQGKYELGWCVKAIESVDAEDLEGAKSWLDRNAPRSNYK